MARMARTPPKAARPRAPAAEAEPALKRYRAKRNFDVTAEPSGAPKAKARPKAAKAPKLPSFVIQKHWASRLHYDFRLEWGGVMWSWAVPKGPSFDPADKRMAVHVEDHPLDYARFEGTIPPKQYGAGTVIVWDNGSWEPVGDPEQGMKDGKLVFHLHGQKLAGLWELVRIAKPGDRQDPWMLFKKRDAWARPAAEYDVVTALPDSVVAKPLGPVEEREPREAATTPADKAAPKPAPATPKLSKAPKADLPDKLAPQLAMLASAPPTGDWIVETKFDGYRMLARLDAKRQVRLITRNGNDWTAKLKLLAEAVRAALPKNSWIDGEIVVLNAHGVPDFNALQNAIDGAHNERIVYFVFDAPFLDGRDLRAWPTRDRRAALQAALQEDDEGTGRVRFSQAFEAPPAQMLEAACRSGIEGVIIKNPTARYSSTRNEDWLKLKCSQRQEFVVGGYTLRTNSPDEVGGLLLGYHEGGKLVYAGNVGTGWNHATGRDLLQALKKIEAKSPPFDDPGQVKPGRWSRRSPGGEHWVKPQMVVEVNYTEWTPDGRVRHPVFKGVRSDKPATAITRERALAPPPGPKGAATSVKVTNPERVIDPASGLTKLDLVRYYESVAEWILPHLQDRPVSLVRAPTGITGQLFFQKHPESRMPGLTELDPVLWPGHSALLAVSSAQALVAAAQMNVVEFHTWNSTASDIDRPDRVVFDLDPGEGVSWPQLQEAALLMHVLLQELELEAWLKTTGGKGLHVVVPIRPEHGYDAVKAWSKAAVQHMARTIPQRFVAKAGASNRVGRIFIDYLRNGHGATTAAAFSARARPGLGVSMPIAWDQLRGLKSPSPWTIATAREYLSFQQSDPWAGYWKARQSLSEAMTRLEE